MVGSEHVSAAVTFCRDRVEVAMSWKRNARSRVAQHQTVAAVVGIVSACRGAGPRVMAQPAGARARCGCSWSASLSSRCCRCCRSGAVSPMPRSSRASVLAAVGAVTFIAFGALMPLIGFELSLRRCA